ncbi:MAG: hypothetical protein KBG20_10490 [Caldilineaceae bacterium]|nr:hypothetical protein [Caldilineaceae bacterium]MBP8106398.1 hypothetical protein [Caldilineaceae bacterium]MBP8121419.1 hypothetical protein [Caldilineaceae bacterium]MBP9072721.1 hypothetical protein [Caldilineaceae bacterium]
MNTQTVDWIDRVANVLSLSSDDVIFESIESLLEYRLLQLNSQVIAFADKYEVASVTEMETRYQDGTLSELDSWDDFQQFDHLEYDRDRVQELLTTLRATARKHEVPVLA